MTLGVLGEASALKFLAKDHLLWFAKDGAHVRRSDALKPKLFLNTTIRLWLLCVYKAAELCDKVSSVLYHPCCSSYRSPLIISWKHTWVAGVGVERNVAGRDTLVVERQACK